MKSARLHDGRVIKFPDEIDDESISMSIEKLLAREALQTEEEKVDRKNRETAEQKRLDDEKKAKEAQKLAVQQKEKQSLERDDKRHGEKLDYSKKLIEAVQLLAVGMQYLEKSMPDISKLSTQMDGIAKSVASLEKTIKTSSALLAEAFTADKVLTFDAKKRPIGLKTEMH